MPVGVKLVRCFLELAHSLEEGIAAHLARASACYRLGIVLWETSGVYSRGWLHSLHIHICGACVLDSGICSGAVHACLKFEFVKCGLGWFLDCALCGRNER